MTSCQRNGGLLTHDAQRIARSRRRGAGRGGAARARRRRQQARAGPAGPGAAHTRSFAARRNSRLRAGRAGADRPAATPLAEIEAALGRPGRCWPSSRRTGANCLARRRRRADPRRRPRLQPVGAAAVQGRGGARPFSRLPRRQRARRGVQGGGKVVKERHRLRSLESCSPGRMARSPRVEK